MEDWAAIRRLYLSERMPIKAIARRLGLSRNTVRAAARSVMPPRYVRTGSGSIVDAAEPQVRALLKEFSQMPATVIAERIGWTRSLTVLKDRIRELRPIYAPVDPASRTTYQPGERAQCDLWSRLRRSRWGGARSTRGVQGHGRTHQRLTVRLTVG